MHKRAFNQQLSDQIFDKAFLSAIKTVTHRQPVLLEGINGTIFMYGQTGAGKTYTMLGDYSVDINASN